MALTLPALRDVLNKGCDPNFRCEEDRGRTLLHICVCEEMKIGKYDKVKLLLKHKANPNIPDKDKMTPKTPLIEAIYANNIPMVRLLLKHGADVNLRLTRQITPLHESVSRDQMEMTALLLLHRASVNAGEEFERTPIFYAISRGMCELLKGYGADVFHISLKNESPLHTAARHGSGESARFFIEQGLQVDLKDTRNFTPLHIASAKNHQHVVQILLDYGADIQAKTANGHNCMELADAKDHMELAFYLYIRHTGSNKATMRERLKNPLFLFLSAILGTGFYLHRDIAWDLMLDFAGL